MNPDILNLYQIAQKGERLIIGLMSGTSLDGLDVALCKIKSSGLETKLELVSFETEPYTKEAKKNIRKVFAKKNIHFQDLCLLNEWIGILHAEIILKLLKKWKVDPTNIDLIGSHGQTVFHAPYHIHQQKNFTNATLQIGDGDHIAVKTGIITVSDFRQKHLAAGGEGAPLAIYGDYFLFSSHNENRIMLNMGGIANFTFLPQSLEADKIFTTDTGPANTLIDAFVRIYFPELFYDKNGEIAQSGKINQILLNELKKFDFFSISSPKTTGPEMFNKEYVNKAILKSNTEEILPQDLIATLTRFSAETIADSIKNYTQNIDGFKILMSGGGAKNETLVNSLKELLPTARFALTDTLGISTDAKEAVLFAVLANECIAGDKNYFSTSKNIPDIKMGKISFPR